MKTERVKGFNDFLGEEAEKREQIRKILVETFQSYGYEPAETPIVEYEEFVKGDKEQQEDEAVSDIFRLKDKGKRELALRYEFTFQLKRIANGQKLPYKRYQIGSVFRDEPASSNRFRQFTQCDVDIIGSTGKEEAEILAISYNLLKQLGIEPVILFNNRKLLNEILSEFKINEKDRQNVLRELDKYDKLPESEVKKNLKKYKAEKIIDALKKGESYFKKFGSYKDVLKLIEYCKLYGIKVSFSPTIIRGFSYYNGSVWEIKAKGVKETIVAGGSYMINGFQSTGISFGLERLCLVSKLETERDKYLVVSLEQDKEAIKLAQKLRENGNVTSLYYGKPSKALDYANSKKYNKAIFVGEKEVKSKKFMVKDLKTGKEKELKA